jgi:hypothetical protein
MAPPLALPIASCVFFVLSTAFFYFFPRTIAAAVVLAFMILKADSLIRLFHSVDIAAAPIALVLFLWFVPGLFADVRAFKTRWIDLEDYITRAL